MLSMLKAQMTQLVRQESAMPIATVAIYCAKVGNSRMMRPPGEYFEIYLHRAPIDMRRSCNGLAAIAREAIQVDPFGGALFIFLGRRFDSLKILYWERNVFATWWKRIESDEKYKWLRLLAENVVTLTTEQINRLPDGYDIWAKPHRMIKFSHIV
jgi:transposase